MTVNHTGHPATAPGMSTQGDIPTPDRQNVARPVDALFPSHAILRRSGLCPRCGEAVDVGEFTDDVSRAEWRLTGFCAGCQTRIYQHLVEMEGDE